MLNSKLKTKTGNAHKMHPVDVTQLNSLCSLSVIFIFEHDTSHFLCCLHRFSDFIPSVISSNVGLMVFTFNRVKFQLLLHALMVHFVLLLLAGLPVRIKVAAKRFPALVVALVESLARL